MSQEPDLKNISAKLLTGKKIKVISLFSQEPYHENMIISNSSFTKFVQITDSNCY